MPQGRFDALDSLRGLAALVVVVNHCLNLFPPFGGLGSGQSASAPDPWVAALLRSPLSLAWHGKGAVALFFVLSGFVLALPWFRVRGPSYGSFVTRRFCRIYLPYAVAVGLAMALAAALSGLRPPPLTQWFDTANWIEPIGWAAVLDHVLMLGAHNTFDNAVWSLNHEMRLSLVFPLVLLPVLRFGPAGAVVLAVALYGGAGAITHFAGWNGPPAEVAATLRFGTFFVLGALLARYADALAVHRSPWSGPAAWCALLAGLFLLWGWQEPAVMALGSGLVILAAVLPGGIRDGLLRPAPRALGRISYSLYLIHLLVILSAVHLLYGRLPLPTIAAGAFAAALPVAWVFHLWIEAPANRLGRCLAAPAPGAEEPVTTLGERGPRTPR